jgi:hypothetical protein
LFSQKLSEFWGKFGDNLKNSAASFQESSGSFVARLGEIKYNLGNYYTYNILYNIYVH